MYAGHGVTYYGLTNTEDDMTPGFKKIIEDAKAQGCEVREDGSAVQVIARRHRGTGRILCGMILYPYGTAIDMTVEPAIAKGVRRLDQVRNTLGLA